MPALTVRNIPDDVHRSLKAQAALHGRSTEAEIRDILSRAVKPEGRPRLGQALSGIWKAAGITDEEAAVLANAGERTPAAPMALDE